MSFEDELIKSPTTKAALSPPPVVSYFHVTFMPGYLNNWKFAKSIFSLVTQLRIEEFAAVVAMRSRLGALNKEGIPSQSDNETTDQKNLREKLESNAETTNLLDFRFNKVSGLASTIETDTIREGGFNTEQMQLPSHISHPNLVLERGFIEPKNSLTARELGVAMNLMIMIPGEIVVSVLKPDGKTIVAAWLFRNAYPVHWSNADLASDDSDIFMEKMEFAYSHRRQLELFGSDYGVFNQLAG